MLVVSVRQIAQELLPLLHRLKSSQKVRQKTKRLLKMKNRPLKAKRRVVKARK